jgi:hypothetical protein
VVEVSTALSPGRHGHSIKNVWSAVVVGVSFLPIADCSVWVFRPERSFLACGCSMASLVVRATLVADIVVHVLQFSLVLDGGCVLSEHVDDVRSSSPRWQGC